MKIQRIKIEGFGLFNEQKEFSFDENRLNIIYGNNETGKTTLLRGITALLFGLDKSRWAFLKSSGPADKYCGEIQFSDKGDEYTLFRDFQSNRVLFSRRTKKDTVENLFAGKASPRARSEEKEFYYDILKKVIGLNNEDVFKNVNIIFQKSIESRIDKEIQHILTGAVGTNYKTVQEEWMREYFNITRKSSWDEIQDRRNDKIIEVLEKEINELIKKKESIMDTSIKSSKIDEDLKKIDTGLKALEEEIKINDKEYELSRRYIDLLKEKSNNEDKILYCNREIDKYNNWVAERDVRKDRLEKEFSQFKDISDEDIQLIKNSIALEQEMERKGKDLNNYKGKKDLTPGKRIMLGINGVIISVLFFLVKLLIYNKPYLLYISVGIGVTSAVYLILSIISRYQIRFNYHTQLFLKDNSIKELQDKLADINNKSKHLSEFKNRKDLFEKYNEYKKEMEEADRLNYTINKATDPEEYISEKKESEKALISINSEIKKLEKENPGLAIIKQDKDRAVSHIQQLKEATDKKKISTEELKKKIYKLNKELTLSMPETESIASINFRSEEATEELNRYNTSKEAYELAVNTLSEAITEYQEEHIGRLSKNISKYYKKITKEKDRKVLLTEDFEPMVRDKDDKEETNLSCGAEDQLYFSVRLALLKEINDLTPLPLLLDDPFVNFDRLRLEVVKDILYSICKENQVILFTHIKPYLKWDDINLIMI